MSQEEVPTNYKIVIDNWEELKEIPIMDLFDKGWKPRVKSKPDGKRYITIRNKWKDDDGKWHDREKGLGPYDPERWEVLLDMYPKEDIFPKRGSPKKPTSSSILASKVAKPKPLSSTVHIELETLQWYKYAQSIGYPGNLDDFINQAVDEYFREHHHLELAVIIEKA